MSSDNPFKDALKEALKPKPYWVVFIGKEPNYNADDGSIIIYPSPEAAGKAADVVRREVHAMGYGAKVGIRKLSVSGGLP